MPDLNLSKIFKLLLNWEVTIDPHAVENRYLYNRHFARTSYENFDLAIYTKIVVTNLAKNNETCDYKLANFELLRTPH